MSKTVITAEPGAAQIIVTREFDAPRDLVFRAHTDPDLCWTCRQFVFAFTGRGRCLSQVIWRVTFGVSLADP